MASKTCPRCKRTGVTFHRNAGRSDGWAVYCVQCTRERYAKNSEHNRNQAKQRAKKRAAAYRRGWRAKAIERYGGKCQCCGETELAFLCLDHISGGGSQARSVNAYAEMRNAALNYQPLRYQVLCANCNMAKEREEGCPHQRDHRIHKTRKEER